MSASTPSNAQINPMRDLFDDEQNTSSAAKLDQSTKKKQLSDEKALQTSNQTEEKLADGLSSGQDQTPLKPSLRAKKDKDGPTPMMAQYLEIKAVNPDCLLFYRMGDFYELFFDDAKMAAGPLGLALTKRGKHEGQDIPMAGVPVHAVDDYLSKAITAGFKVAVAEQMEDPKEAKKRGYKAVVKRDVVRLITPGTLTEDHLLEAKANNYLTALFSCPVDKGADKQFVAASLDISTGDFLLDQVKEADLYGLLARLSPSELICVDELYADQTFFERSKLMGISLTPVAGLYFDSRSGQDLLKKYLNVKSLDGFGTFDRFDLAAISALLKYVELTQIDKRPIIRPPKQAYVQDYMLIDLATRQSLEILKTNKGERRGSLLHAIDRTVTGSGARALASWLAAPLMDLALVRSRQMQVQYFLDQSLVRSDLRQTLNGLPDMARALSRISLGRASPRDMGALQKGFLTASSCYEILGGASLSAMPDDLAGLHKQLIFGLSDLAKTLEEGLLDELPVLKRDGNFIKSDFNDELKENRLWRDEGRAMMNDLQERYREDTGIKNLKIKHNNQLGFYIEVTKTHSDRLMAGPLSDVFRHRQTLLNAMRFSTEELIEVQSKISLAKERAIAIELEIFDEFCEKILACETEVLALADALASLDCFLSFAQLAENENYICPVVTSDRSFQIEGGRHPVVEQALRKAAKGPFIQNDCQLNGTEPLKGANQKNGKTGKNLKKQPPQLILLTGPNMAGKSTYLRQNALIAILAQIGSFVPAKAATIGLIDRLFSRVGASDDLARGHSTFMVEMVETAAILNQATDRSMVILDEIGRGTATFDGLSIALAVVEYLHNQLGSRAIFATHYHELTHLETRLKAIANFTIAVKEWQDDIVFLYEIKKGAADRSYGIQVAKLAGLPKGVIARAQSVLALLEDQKTGSGQGGSGQLFDELPLFETLPDTPIDEKGHGQQVKQYKISAGLFEKLETLNPDELTPKQALDCLYQLKELQKEPQD